MLSSLSSAVNKYPTEKKNVRRDLLRLRVSENAAMVFKLMGLGTKLLLWEPVVRMAAHSLPDRPAMKGEGEAAEGGGKEREVMGRKREREKLSNETRHKLQPARPQLP